jgi:hypothetical protein
MDRHRLAIKSAGEWYHWIRIGLNTQSRQSARLFLQSSELGSPTPSPGGECVPPRLVPGEGGTNSYEGTRHCGFLGIYVLCRPKQRGLIYTEVQPLGRLCQMCKSFFHEFWVIPQQKGASSGILKLWRRHIQHNQTERRAVEYCMYI